MDTNDHSNQQDKGTKNPIMYVIIIFLLLGLSGAGWAVNTLISDKNNEIDELRTDLKESAAELTSVREELASLENRDSSAVEITQSANDEQRKKDLTLFISTINQYRADTGEFPANLDSIFFSDFFDPYVRDQFSTIEDPNTQRPYEFTVVVPVQTPPGVTLGNIQYQWPGECAGSEFFDTSNTNKAAVRTILESGEIYCQDV